MGAGLRAKLQHDDRIYEGATITELLEAMRRSSRYPEADLKEWMVAYADRIRKWDGQTPIDCTTPETFAAAMIYRRHLTLIEP